jgi:hypothetical protein
VREEGGKGSVSEAVCAQVNKVLMGQRATPAVGARELRLFHGTKPDSVDKINAQVGGGAREEFAQEECERNAVSLSRPQSI